MSGIVRVWLLPSHFTPSDLRGGIAIVVDQLRASTTICAALAAGASAVRPCLEPPEALAIRQESAPGSCLCGGERGGVRIDGFDLGNSPAEYTAHAVRGRVIAFTTTNGTVALLRASEADRILVGCLANTSVLARSLHAERRDIHIICAGTGGRLTLDDVLAAGAIADALRSPDGPATDPDPRIDDDSTTLAVDAWRAASQARGDGGVLAALRRSSGGRNLHRIGLGGDVELCSRRDLYPVLPVFDARTGLIRLDEVLK